MRPLLGSLCHIVRLPRYPGKPVESSRNFSEVRTPKTAASRKKALRERQRGTSWQVCHIAPASTGVLPEGQGHHGYARELHPTKVPRAELTP